MSADNKDPTSSNDQPPSVPSSAPTAPSDDSKPVLQNAAPSVPSPTTPPPTPPHDKDKPKANFLQRNRKKLITAFAAVSLGGVGGYAEMRTSYIQSHIFSRVASGELFSSNPKKSEEAPPAKGPYDQRLGYDRAQQFENELAKRDFKVTSPETWHQHSVMGLDLHPIYDEKPQAGLRILDDVGNTVFQSQYPNYVFNRFEDIPPLVVRSLLFVEDRELLNEKDARTRNPVVDWERIAKAIITGGEGSGGSTLATQIEKFRHSPNGQTADAKDKLRQMLTASVRVYNDGRDTRDERRDIVLHYLNSMPLAGFQPYGEVNGFAQGLATWYNADVEKVTALLKKPESQYSEAEWVEAATAYRQSLALIMAVKKPGFYLTGRDRKGQPTEEGRRALEARIDTFLPLMVQQGVISPRMADEVRKVKLEYSTREDVAARQRSAPPKAVQSLRVKLNQSLGNPGLYALDRFDVTARTTVDAEVSASVSQVLRDLSDPEKAVEMGVTGYRLLDPQYASSVIYTFSLYEKTAQGNVLRVQTDNYQGPLNLNEGSKLELGSTAKLRTLVSYLEAVSEVHALYGERSPEELQMIRQTISPKDNITLWAIDYLTAPETDKTLKGMVNASLDRTYSAATGEIFFTGGGAHQFVNFDNKDNGRIVTVREATYKSINLPYIRMMRDVVNFNMTHKMNVDPAIFTDISHPRRAEYLEKFADMEGRQFMNMFWKQMQGQTPEQMLTALAGKTRGTPAQLAVVYRHVYPEAPVEKMSAFIVAHCKNCNPNQNFESLYTAYAPGKFNLNDQGYIARVHPLELWLTAYRINHPDAKRSDVLALSKNERIEVYKWLLRSNKYEAQNNRIRIMLEQEAFSHIRQSWQEIGFPFSQMIPSYASALGASGDTPKGLATMAGILQNGGVQKPTIDFRSIEFGTGTPYQFKAQRQTPPSKRILPQEVADAAVEVMQGVIERGTARRAYQSIKLADGTILPVGGKTGTGDNRDESHTSSGATKSSSVRNRTAAFVFTVGDRFYGSIVAYVPGEQAANFKFTSALPVTVFTKLAPALSPVLNRAYTGARTEEAVPEVNPIEMQNLPAQSIDYQGEKPPVPVDGDNVPVISYDPDSGAPVVPGEAPKAPDEAAVPVETPEAADSASVQKPQAEVTAAPANDNGGGNNDTMPQNQPPKALPAASTPAPKRQGPAL